MSKKTKLSPNERIVSKVEFERVQKLLEERSPKITPPRTVDSQYLLSGVVFCKKCGASLSGAPAKSSKYFYYMCGHQRKSGKKACDSRMVRVEILDAHVLEGISRTILIEDNITELVRLTNEELAREGESSHQHLQNIEGQLEDVNKRLGKLYDALETGKIDLDSLAPRIQELKERKESLERQRENLRREMDAGRPQEVDEKTIRRWVEDMQMLLRHGELHERRAFIRSFVTKVVVDYPNKVVVNYRMPKKQKVEPRLPSY